jgi:NAD(P)-dependent dehydrogenase (short-subunit alcohol dehydrogenase family)
VIVTDCNEYAGADIVKLFREEGGEVFAVDRDLTVPSAADDLIREVGHVDILIANFAYPGRYDAVIHNAGVGYREPRRIETIDGLSHIFAINVLAPYVLTALVTPPDRLIYLSSGMHTGGDALLDDPQWTTRRWNGAQAYATSKLLDVVLAFAVARRWPKVLSNALEPGWVATKMGGPGAPGDLSLAPVTQAWLAVSDDPAAKVTGQYFYHQRRHRVHSAVYWTDLQDELLTYCAGLSATVLPGEP